MANKRLFPPALFLAALLFFCLLTQPNAQIRKPIVYGICLKPFPLIANLEYPLCRAEAWLAALDMAVANLPAPLLTRLRAAGFATPLARLALAALLCPLDVVTPENVSSAKIRVFLKWPDDPLQAGLALLDKTSILQMEMAFIWETKQAAHELSNLWPASVSSGQQTLERMEELAAALNDLWQASIFNSDEPGGKSAPWSSAFQKNNISASLLIASAEARLPRSTASMDKALSILLDRETELGEDAPLWNWLSARALLLRGRIHAQRDSVALAEADFKTAIARLQKTDNDNQLASQAWLNLGHNYRERGDIGNMCAAFEAACAQGECQTLSLARRNKLCLPAPE